MLKAVEDAFTIIHIRISGVKIFGICARHFITGGLVVFIVINTARMFLTLRDQDILGFLEAAVFMVLTLILCLAWVISWPKAGKMLNRAVDYEKKHKERD